MMFEMVLEMVMACGAVCEHGGVYHFAYDMDVDFSAFGADTLGTLCALLGRDVTAYPCGFGELVYDVLKAEAEKFDSSARRFSGLIDGKQFDFVVDYD